MACSTPKPGAKVDDEKASVEPSTGGFKFGMPTGSSAPLSSAGFKFGVAGSTTTDTTKTDDSKPTGFAFGQKPVTLDSAENKGICAYCVSEWLATF